MIEQSRHSDIYKQAFQEIKDKRNETVDLTSDIDVVWVLSQPGTYSQASNSGAYDGLCLNKIAVDYGVSLVKEITSLRLGHDNISQQEIADHGPILFYNGEDKDTVGVNYLQNEDLQKIISSKNFPIPPEKVIIDHIDGINTIYQVFGFMKFFKDKPDVRKVAVITSLPHSTRVARYLEDYRTKHPDSFLLHIDFIGAWIPKNRIEPEKSLKERTFRGVRLIRQEIGKVDKYFKKGDLTKDRLKGL